MGDGCSNILPSSLGAIHVQIVFRFGGDERSNAFRLGAMGVEIVSRSGGDTQSNVLLVFVVIKTVFPQIFY